MSKAAAASCAWDAFKVLSGLKVGLYTMDNERSYPTHCGFSFPKK